MDLSSYLAPHGIALTGVVPLAQCSVRKPYLLERAGFKQNEFDSLSVQIFAIPYLSEAAMSPDRNVSAYAVCKDYHLFVRELEEQLLPAWHRDFPENRFALFADHSPIDEVQAAVLAGLGVRGQNHLLLTRRYSSYVFLGEIVTDLPLTPTLTAHMPTSCESCDACKKVCPMIQTGGECRSALTQKKSPLTPTEAHAIATLSCLWGCDLCQQVCPYTTRALRDGTIFSPIPFFQKDTLPHLTVAALNAMSEEDLARRAYAWRGRETILRNLVLAEQAEREKNEKEG